MRSRQIHLDFHTSEAINEIGKDFDKNTFQKALLESHADSITLFSKCHHGWSYHPTKVNVMHPNLNFDLLKAQIEAAHEIGIKTPVYLSAGFDHRCATEHPEYLIRNKDETVAGPSFKYAGYQRLCFNSPYLDLLAREVIEVCENYDADGIFLDIAIPFKCYCHNCRKILRDEGKDPYDSKNAEELAERTYAKYTQTMRKAVDSVKPGLPIFHNGGAVPHGRRDLIFMNAHIEIEALPTGGWGYDHFPMIARYIQPIGCDFLGMTGKFHLSWGEFGGYKHIDALRYESSLAAAHGGKFSIGDQLHPRGATDDETYRMIGKVYAELEEKEPWLCDVSAVSDIAVYSAEAWYHEHHDCGIDISEAQASNKGVFRMMKEGHYLFDFVDAQSDISQYRLLILPDIIGIDSYLKGKIDGFVSKGGRVLVTGLSGLEYANGKYGDGFALKLGAEYHGVRDISPVFMYPDEFQSEIGYAPYVVYSESYEIKATGKVKAQICEPYFKRSAEHFCSHLHAPHDASKTSSGMTVGDDGAYIAAKIFREYGDIGSRFPKQLVDYAISLLGDIRTVKTNLPPTAEMTFMEQKNAQRYILHMLYAPRTVKGSKNIEVIEECVPLHDTELIIRCGQHRIKRAYLAPKCDELSIENIKNGQIRITVPKFRIHGMVVLEYGDADKYFTLYQKEEKQ